MKNKTNLIVKTMFIFKYIYKYTLIQNPESEPSYRYRCWDATHSNCTIH